MMKEGQKNTRLHNYEHLRVAVLAQQDLLFIKS